MTNRIIALMFISLATSQAYAQIANPATGDPQIRRSLRPADIYRMKTVSDCRPSPDGGWIAYTLSTVDSAKDKTVSHIWMSSWDGKTHIPLTHGREGEESPRWSPDGKWLSFSSERPDKDDEKDEHEPKTSRLWILDRRGGEAQPLLDVKGSLQEYCWSPNAKKILLVIQDPDYADTSKSRKRLPFVMDRYRFKADIEGYLGTLRTHLYLFDLASKKIDTLTRGPYSESSPAWSPDNDHIAFVSNRDAEPDRNENTDIWLIDTSGGRLQQLTHWRGSDMQPVWSPDGHWIAYLQANTEDSFSIYNQAQLAVIPAQGGAPRIFGVSLDRPVSNVRWSPDSRKIAVLVTDDLHQYPAAFSLSDGSMQKIADCECSYTQLEPRADGGWVAIMSAPQLPSEIYAIESDQAFRDPVLRDRALRDRVLHDQARRLTRHTDEYLSILQLANVSSFRSTSGDGTKVSGLLFSPPGQVQSAGSPSSPMPLIIYIHGGPSMQDDLGFDMERQTLAAAGFAVAAVNYRGSNGRGAAYCNTIRADWGNKEVKDILGSADHLVSKGIADSTRMGIMGWSYGGILTDYTIASTTRFRAASSGAGSALQLSMYGIDQYVNQYDNELGSPWVNPDKWIALSYPFFKANRIRTPTLFMASQSDFNVPSAGAEQMYQALRTLRIPTQLVIYPGQYHELTVPSYQVDRLQRWIAWFGKYLGPIAGGAGIGGDGAGDAASSVHAAVAGSDR